MVLDHDHDRPLVDAQIVAVDPAHARHDPPVLQPALTLCQGRIEGIEEAELGIDAGAVAGLHRFQAGGDRGRGERHRGHRRCRGDGAVVAVAGPARRIAEEFTLATVDDLFEIARPVAGRQAPDLSRIARPAHRIVDGVFPLRRNGAHAVLEIVEGADLGRFRPHPRVANAAEVDKHMAVLVAEQRGEGQMWAAPAVSPAAVIDAAPLVPHRRRDRMGGAADGQQQHQHAFVIDVPVMRDVAGLRMPAHGDAVGPYARPVPFDPVVDRLGQAPNFHLVGMVAVEPARGEQHAGDQQSGVDRRQLGPAETVTGLHVEEMVEEALVAGDARRLRPLRGVVEEADGGQGALARLGPADPAPLDPDRPAGQGEADGSHRREGLGRPAVGRQTVGPVGDMGEPAEGAFLQFIDLGVDPRRHRPHRFKAGQGSAGRNAQRRRAGDRGTHQKPATIHGLHPHTLTQVSQKSWPPPGQDPGGGRQARGTTTSGNAGPVGHCGSAGTGRAVRGTPSSTGTVRSWRSSRS